MAVKIKDVSIQRTGTTWQEIKNDYASWDEISELPTWGSIYAHSKLPVAVNVGEQIIITVVTDEPNWEKLNNEFTDWGEVRRSFTNWNKVLNYIYSKPNPTPSSNALYTSDGFALFDVDAVEICISGGGQSAYDGDTINYFIGRVLNG